MKKRAIVPIILLLLVTIFAIALTISCTNDIEILRVTFDSQGGSAINALDVAKGYKLGEPAVPTKDGYSFGGWYKERECITRWDFTKDKVVSNIILYSKWVIESYAVNYDANGAAAGSVPESQLKTHDIDLTVSINSGNLLKAGYTFAGWNTKADGSGVDYAAGSSLSTNVATTLYAKWVTETYTITYDANGATSGILPTSQTKTHNIDQVVMANVGNLIRTGYTYSGWNTKSDGSGTDYSGGSLFSINAATTLYAKWIADEYTVTYDANEATAGSVPASQTKLHDIDLAVSTNSGNLLKAGYTFSGWNTKADGSGKDYSGDSLFSVNAATTLYAKWLAGTYTINYDANGATSGTVPTNQTKTYNVDQIVFGNIGNLTRAGYNFSSWNTKADGSGDNYTGGLLLSINGDTTLYAKWVADTYTVTYNDNDATGGYIPLVQVKTHGIDLEVRSNTGDLVRTGYSFGGWNTQSNGSGTDYPAGSSFSTNSATTLYAKWVADSYSITYHANGSTSGAVPATQTKTHEIDLVVAANTGNLVRTGYTFAGWNAKADGSGTDYTAGSSFSTNSATTLYAKWIPKVYVVSYNANGATSGTIPDDQLKTHGVGLALATNTGGLSRTGYMFSGWSSIPNPDTESGVDYYEGYTFTEDGDKTLYARWYANIYTIFFDYQDEYCMGTEQFVTYDAEMPSTSIPTRAGYVFDGFYDEPNGQGVQYYATETWSEYISIFPVRTWDKASNATLYAKWIPLRTVTFNSQDGSSIDSMEIISGNRILEPATPTKNGFVFVGWYKETECITEWDFSSDKIISDITLYAKWRDYELREAGPAGGYVFYDKGEYTDGWRYLESAPASTEWTGVEWGGYLSRLPLELLIGETNTDIGTGRSNTTKIVTAIETALEERYHKSSAKLCDELEVNRYGVVYDDWFLPSKDELNQMYQVLSLSNLGGLDSRNYNCYWSSSEYNIIGAWCQYFNYGSGGSWIGQQFTQGKDEPRDVRAVRAF
ncbi:Listeria/Bacterioides repeat-containing protein [Sphaerochaeta associata]|uniref:InlB B-repeat-containing protein n=1 Tax=Sphaerochaeta associata TaxID=1129264 RepID=UPI000E055A70|nr:InlB B-repeat-containing protein [Sphaerochaeta associata]SMP65425.1 Listeria/Bacterioides repeat-containing protein [Sphaerochaeta associata]